MNRIYRIVYNRTLGLWQTTSEAARARGKSAGGASCGALRGRTLAGTIALTLTAGPWADEVVEDDVGAARCAVRGPLPVVACLPGVVVEADT
ncbi:ESPR domain-containing protein [Gilvimarinus sp. F26214L]|uniref:ESPR domain-containing protein n=1 Tax=Gilvimarinus sp. DZF01 TaxID=3461371 RepID=UPI0040454491